MEIVILSLPRVIVILTIFTTFLLVQNPFRVLGEG